MFTFFCEEIGNKDSSIYTLINEGVTYLDSRAEFWRQQKPMYTRKREKILRRWKPPPTRPINPSSRHTKSGKDQFTDHTKFVLKALEDIDNSKLVHACQALIVSFYLEIMQNDLQV